MVTQYKTLFVECIERECLNCIFVSLLHGLENHSFHSTCLLSMKYSYSKFVINVLVVNFLSFIKLEGLIKNFY